MIEDQLKDLLRTGNIGDALEKLLYAVGRQHDDIHNDLIMLSARLNANQRLYNLGMLEYEKLQRENATITSAILRYIEEAAANNFFDDTDFERMNEADEEKSVRILFIAANPIGTPRFELEKEFLAIRKIFANKRNHFDVIELFNTTLDNLFEKVKTERPDILHISGPATENHLVLHRDNDHVRSVPYHFLSAAFRMFQPYVKCLFVNTMCSKVFLKKVSMTLEAAIGSEILITDNEAIIFSTGWYTAIAQGESRKDAFNFGMKLLQEHQVGNGARQSDVPPFTMFINGVNLDPNDETPAEYEIEEPADVMDRLQYAAKHGVRDGSVSRAK